MYAAPEPDSGAAGTSRETRELLKQHGLKRLARNDPAEAIRALDRARTEGSRDAISRAIAEIALTAGRDGPVGASAGLFLRAAVESDPVGGETETAGGPSRGSSSAGDSYSRAIEGLLESLQASDSSALRGRPQTISGPLSSYELSWVDAPGIWTPATHHFVAASSLDRKERQFLGLRSGAGTPVLAVAKEDPADLEDADGGILPVFEYFYPLTVVLELGSPRVEAPRPAVVRVLDPRTVDAVDVGGTEYPLAMDIGSQLAALTAEVDIASAKKATVRPGKYLSQAGLYLLEPFRAGRIPAVLVHGLSSSPRTWTEVLDALELDAELRTGYQFWFFAYPTGLPFTYSAVLLRRALVEAVRELEAVGDDPAHDRTVLIGHSMGGLLARMQVTDAGTLLWEALFTVPPEEIELAEEDVALFREILMVEPLPFVERVIFCSVPHRGSKYAANAIGKLGASAVKVPRTFVEFGVRTLSTAAGSLTAASAERGKMPDSVQSLQPEFPILKALDDLGIDPGVTYHSIIGDRGKGDSPDSSDGVVAYWSSHLEGAASEEIVPSGHASHKHPEGVAELVRILRLHLAPEPLPKVETGAVDDLAKRLAVAAAGREASLCERR